MSQGDIPLFTRSPFGRKKKEATMLEAVVLAMGLMAMPSIAQTQQQQCQLECTWVNGKGEKTRVSRISTASTLVTV